MEKNRKRKSLKGASSGRWDTNLVIADQAMVSGINFATGLLLARFLGLEGYGQYVLAYGIIMFVAGFHVALVISPMMVIGAARSVRGSSPYYRSVFPLQFFFCFLMSVSAYVLSSALSSMFPQWGLDPLPFPLAAAAFCFLIQDFLRRYFFAQDRPAAAFLNDLVGYGLRLLVLIWLGWAGGLDSGSALWAIAGASTAAIAVGAVQARATPVLAGAKLAESRRVTEEHWNFGKWLIASNLAYWSTSQLVIYMVGAVLSVSLVGALSATRNLVAIAQVLFLAMENMVPSRGARIHAATHGMGLNRYLARVSILGGGATLAIVLAAGLWAEGWLGLIYGNAYSGYGWLVWWWGLYFLIGFFHRPLSAGLRVLGRTKGIFRATSLGALIALVAALPAIEFMGITGSMLVLVTIQVGILAVMFRAYRKHGP